MANLSIPNVLNSKSLEKQLKVVDTRLEELQSEMDALQRIREACQLLLGNQEQTLKTEGAPETSKKSSKSNSAPIEETSVDESPSEVSTIQ